MRRITAVAGNSQWLDGGAMFGNAPRPLWERWIAPDDRNRIPLACRAMLIEDGARNILFETGIGAFFDPKLRDRYGVAEDRHVLLDSLAVLGLTDRDIDVVVLSHLHFDHAGGLLTAWRPDRAPELLFPNARFVVGRDAWARANAPHFRDRASFVPELQPMLAASRRLDLVDGPSHPTLGEGYRFHLSNGHTPGLLLTEVEMPAGPVVFVGDLIPGRSWVHVPITMGYDRYPELLIDEKECLLTDLVTRSGRLFFTHDPEIALAKVIREPSGRFSTVDPIESPVGIAA